jgi:membrane peptidoglycan carboxypeptidase
MIRPVSLATRILATVYVALLTVFVGGYAGGVQEFLNNDPREQIPFAGTVLFARPRTVTIGDRVAPQEIEAYLSSVGYSRQNAAEPGTYARSAEALEIRPQYPEFNAATISFSAGQIARIQITSGPLAALDLEPPILKKFVEVRAGAAIELLPAEQIPLRVSQVRGSVLRDAVVASEDRWFDHHHGLNDFRLPLAALEGRGGSTVSNQVARNVVLHDLRRSLSRKWRELFVTMALERCVSKDEIMTLYLNNAYYGRQGSESVFGAAAAARAYFDKSIEHISLAEAATLAGMLNGPGQYIGSGARKEETVERRRARVLDLMRQDHPDRYSPQDIRKAEAEAVRLVDSDSAPELGAHFVADVLQQEGARTERIYTTLDAPLQTAAEAAVGNRLRARPDLEAALVALDVRTGDVLALVGGTSFNKSSFDRATRARRSPGSAVKPFVYGAAIRSGIHHGSPFTAATWIDPSHDPVDGFRPSSHSGVPGRARREIAASSNGAAVVAAHDAGLAIVQEVLHRAIGSSPALDGMLAIGGNAGSEVTVLNLAAGYTAFARGGSRVVPRWVLRTARDRETNMIPVPAPVQVFDGATAFVVNDMLKSVVGSGPDGDWGTARSARALSGLTDPNIQIRGKTGTGEVGDLWFVGFTPRICVAVWVGSDQNEKLPMDQGYSGGAWALPIWAEFMRGVAVARPDLLTGRFDTPETVEKLRIDPARGCLTRGSGMDEFFIRGRVPQLCSALKEER